MFLLFVVISYALYSPLRQLDGQFLPRWWLVKQVVLSVTLLVILIPILDWVCYFFLFSTCDNLILCFVFQKFWGNCNCPGTKCFAFIKIWPTSIWNSDVDNTLEKMTLLSWRHSKSNICFWFGVEAQCQNLVWCCDSQLHNKLSFGNSGCLL